MDKIALALGLTPLSEEKLKEIKLNVKENLKYAKQPASYGPMHIEIKKAISETLMGHEISLETKQKISKTVSIRNSEGVCGFSLGHGSKAGSIGGKSKSVDKIKSIRANQQKSLETIRGSVWMFNSVKRARVPRNEIEDKLSKGWTLGFKR